ncbi:recombinase family protein, partial [Brevundimonas sp. GN22]
MTARLENERKRYRYESCIETQLYNTFDTTYVPIQVFDTELVVARTFAYCRVSTSDQTTANQLQEIESQGFSIEPKRVVMETISGSVAAMERPNFSKLIDRMEEGDVLIVTKLDRLGRNAMDVRATVERLAASGVKVHCLALGGVDLTSAAGKMTMGV